MRRVLRAGRRAAGLRSTVLCVQPQVLVPQGPGLRGVVRFGAHPASRGSALPALATVSPMARGRGQRLAAVKPHSPTTTSTADQHAALACAGWPVRPQSKMPWTTCAPSASRMKRPSARSTSRPKSSTTTPPTTPFGTPHMWRPLWCRRAPPVRLGPVG